MLTYYKLKRTIVIKIEQKGVKINKNNRITRKWLNNWRLITSERIKELNFNNVNGKLNKNVKVSSKRKALTIDNSFAQEDIEYNEV